MKGAVMRSHRQAVLLKLRCKFLNNRSVSSGFWEHSRTSGHVEDAGGPSCKAPTFGKGLAGAVPRSVEWCDFLFPVEDVRRSKDAALHRQHARLGVQPESLNGSALNVRGTLEVKQSEACARCVRIAGDGHCVLVGDAGGKSQHPGSLVSAEELAVRLARQDGAQFGGDVYGISSGTDVENRDIRLLQDVALFFEVVEHR